MHVLAKLAIVLAVGLALGLAAPGPVASADGGGLVGYQPGANASCDPGTGTCGAFTNAPGGAPSTPGPSGPGGSGNPPDCPVPYTYDYVSYTNGGPLTLAAANTANGQPAELVNIFCQGSYLRTVLMSLGSNPAPAPVITGADLAQQAYASFKLAAPAPGMAPRPDRLVVQFPTWLWVGDWKAQTATAAVPGLSATVTAAPTKAVWTMGDGGSVTCNGPGTPYDPNVPAEQQSTDCSYTYHQSSAGQPANSYQGIVTVSYGATWTATNGTGGNLGALTVAAPFTARVGEIQAIGIPPG